MTKKEYCENRPTVAYYSGFGGLEVKFIEYGTDDYVYLVAGAWTVIRHTTNSKYITATSTIT